jgi:hypothetical protein
MFVTHQHGLRLLNEVGTMVMADQVVEVPGL